MRRAVIVTGQCRSGGAAIAEVLHTLGFCMARTLEAPVPPDFRLDFEDASLTRLMAENMMNGLDPGERIGFRTFVRSRVEHAERTGFGERIGFKSPLFSIGSTLQRLEMALAEEEFEDVQIIRCVRDPAAIERSIARQPGAAVMREWNAAIESDPEGEPLVRKGDHLVSGEGLKIRYEDLVQEPTMVVSLLADALGVRDPVAISRAAGRVLAPCS